MTVDELYWNAAGMVSCAVHAPKEHSARWVAEHWEPLPEEFSGTLTCELCSSIDFSIERQRRLVRSLQPPKDPH
jgi:hypothetical protein